MWKIIPNSSYLPEPPEVRNLKQLLAKNSCKCKTCFSHKKSLIINNRDKEIQAVDQSSFDRITRVSANEIHNTLPYKGYLHKDVFCPGCYMALNCLRLNELKYLKDEEIEIKPEIFCCDKSTENKVKVVEISTSDTNLSDTSSKSNVYDDFDNSTISIPVSDMNPKVTKEKVVFQEYVEKPDTAHGTCLCMTNFINTIRPPLKIGDIF